MKGSKGHARSTITVPNAMAMERARSSAKQCKFRVELRTPAML